MPDEVGGALDHRSTVPAHHLQRQAKGLALHQVQRQVQRQAQR